jgi:hypothetical protein
MPWMRIEHLEEARRACAPDLDIVIQERYKLAPGVLPELAEDAQPELRAVAAIIGPESEDGVLSVDGHADHHLGGADLRQHRLSA